MILDLPRPLRAAYLEQLAHGDVELVRQVRAQLRRYESGSGATQAAPTLEPAVGAAPADHPERIGPYRVLERIGRGGMGQVFLAERTDGEIERRVAIKLIGTGFDLPIVQQRFLSERQILAGLDHPSIARLYDAGTTPEGRPYLVMEAIDGLPIDRFCDRHRLELDERLDLFRKVCAAVEHAHRRLVVHRDLKPSNILVTADGTPKLLDFGIAKLLDPDAFPLPLDEVTRTAMRPLTPRWASPEQVRGGAITTASDVWSLGVLLHLLLTGGFPHAPSSPLPELLLEAMERSPEPPSRALSRRLEAGASVPWSPAEGRRVARHLRGDIDTIVAKALRFEAEERYPSVSALDDDLRRHVDGEPVRARRGTPIYRLGKFVRRYRAGVFAVAAILTLVLGFAIVTQRQAAEIREQALRAEEQAERAEQTRDFLADLLRSADEEALRGRDVGLREILQQGLSRVRQNTESPLTERFALLRVVLRVQLDLGTPSDLGETLELALQLAATAENDSEFDLGPEGAGAVNRFSSFDPAGAEDLAERLIDAGLLSGLVALSAVDDLSLLRGRLNQIAQKKGGNRGLRSVSTVGEDQLATVLGLSGALLETGNATAAGSTLLAVRSRVCNEPDSFWCMRAVEFVARYFLSLESYRACEQALGRILRTSDANLHVQDTQHSARLIMLVRCSAFADATSAAREAYAALDAGESLEAGNIRRKYQRALIPLYIAESARRAGAAKAEEKNLAEAIENLRPLSEQHEVIYIDNAYAMALLMADRVEEARPLVEQLIAGGWRRPDFMRLAAEKGALPEVVSPAPTVEDLAAPGLLDYIESLPRKTLDDPELEALFQELETSLARHEAEAHDLAALRPPTEPALLSGEAAASN
ncbi:MAG: serine/threonine-protein kinase [Acidobacteriota bacterium]